MDIESVDLHDQSGKRWRLTLHRSTTPALDPADAEHDYTIRLIEAPEGRNGRDGAVPLVRAVFEPNPMFDGLGRLAVAWIQAQAAEA